MRRNKQVELEAKYIEMKYKAQCSIVNFLLELSEDRESFVVSQVDLFNLDQQNLSPPQPLVSPI